MWLYLKQQSPYVLVILTEIIYHCSGCFMKRVLRADSCLMLLYIFVAKRRAKEYLGHYAFNHTSWSKKCENSIATLSNIGVTSHIWANEHLKWG